MKHWTEEISDVTQSQEYQTAEIEILSPDSDGEYDIDSGSWINDEPRVRYSGRARVIKVRWGTNNGNVQQANPTTIEAFRVQIPPGEYVGVINRGWNVRVTNGFRTPSLESKVFTVTSDDQGASSATRTLECAVDADSRRP